MNYKTLSSVFKISQQGLQKSLATFLDKKYDKVYNNEDFLFAEGDIPVALVAHMDTVFKQLPKDIFHDERRNVMWSPQGLGADDRAGVYAILEIINRGYRPHVIFTTDEEIGGLGAASLVAQFPECPFKECKYLIQLDRRGHKDCVFYDCANDKFTSYVESFGFEYDWGSFSDISVLCPRWGIAGVNLSVGYINEHSKEEHLYLNALKNTINKVTKMLNDAKNAKAFEFIIDPYISRWYPNEKDWVYTGATRINYLPAGAIVKCDCCNTRFLPEDMIPIYGKNGNTKNYCVDCLTDDKKVRWCVDCGEPFEFDEKLDKTLEGVLCPLCRKDRFSSDKGGNK